jgi:Uma2 family endonuclease
MIVNSAGSMTAEELLALNLPNKRTELVRGRLMVREPAGYEHGRVAARTLGRLSAHVYATGCGELLAAETGFTLQRRPDTVRAPDVAYVRADRTPAPGTTGFPELAPDLAVEVRSPDDSRRELADKVADWLAAGTQVVWVVDPRARTLAVHEAEKPPRTLGEEDTLTGGDVLPGFSVIVGDLLG